MATEEVFIGRQPILVGMALIALVFIGPKTLWGWLGLGPFMTGVFRTCPLYRLVGANTLWHGPYS